MLDLKEKPTTMLKSTGRSENCLCAVSETALCPLSTILLSVRFLPYVHSFIPWSHVANGSQARILQAEFR